MRKNLVINKNNRINCLRTYSHYLLVRSNTIFFCDFLVIYYKTLCSTYYSLFCTLFAHEMLDEFSNESSKNFAVIQQGHEDLPNVFWYAVIVLKGKVLSSIVVIERELNSVSFFGYDSVQHLMKASINLNLRGLFNLILPDLIKMAGFLCECEFLTQVLCE